MTKYYIWHYTNHLINANFCLDFLISSFAVLQLRGSLNQGTETTATGTEGVVHLAPLHAALSGGSF